MLAVMSLGTRQFKRVLRYAVIIIVVVVVVVVGLTSRVDAFPGGLMLLGV